MVKKDYQVGFAGSKKLAKAMAKNQPVSTKYSIEMVREIKGKKIKRVEAFLKNIIDKKEHLPLKKFVRKIAHRKGIARSQTKTGKFPLNVAKNFLKLVESLKANADYKGLDPENLIVVHAFASYGFRRISHQKQGRISGKRHQSKSTHIEIIAAEAS